MQLMSIEALKRLAIAAFLGGTISVAFLAPVTLQAGLLDRIEPVARFFCPETGKFAPRYWHGRTPGNNSDNWEACLDSEGKRINSAETHRAIVFSVAGVWFLVAAPLTFTALGRVSTRRRKRAVKL